MVSGQWSVVSGQWSVVSKSPFTYPMPIQRIPWERHPPMPRASLWGRDPPRESLPKGCLAVWDLRGISVPHAYPKGIPVEHLHYFDLHLCSSHLHLHYFDLHLRSSHLHLHYFDLHLCSSRLHLYSLDLHLHFLYLHLHFLYLHLCSSRLHLCSLDLSHAKGIPLGKGFLWSICIILTY